MYNSLYKYMSVRLDLHKHIYPQYIDNLKDMLILNLPVKDVSSNYVDKTITINLTQNLRYEDIKNSISINFMNFLNNDTVDCVLKKCISEEDYKKYKDISSNQYKVMSLYNLTTLNTNKQEHIDSIVILL